MSKVTSQHFRDGHWNTPHFGFYGVTTAAYNDEATLSLKPISTGIPPLSATVEGELQLGPVSNSQVLIITSKDKPAAWKVDQLVLKVYDPSFILGPADGKFTVDKAKEKAEEFFETEKLAYEKLVKVDGLKEHVLPYYGAYSFTRDTVECKAILLGHNKQGKKPTRSLLGNNLNKVLKDIKDVLDLIHKEAGLAHGDLTKAMNYAITITPHSVGFVIMDFSHAVHKSKVDDWQFVEACEDDKAEAEGLFLRGLEER